MAVKASVMITITKDRDTDNITRYYLLQASTASKPVKPTTLTPPKISTAVSGWDDTEPTYTSGSTNTLYFVDRYVYTDGTFQYTEVSKSSSYEAAKEAYNKAQAAQNTANTTQENLDNLQIGGRNYFLKSGDFTNSTTNGAPSTTISKPLTESDLFIPENFKGKEVTLSFDYESNGITGSSGRYGIELAFRKEDNTTQYSGKWLFESSGDQKGRASSTFTIPDTWTGVLLQNASYIQNIAAGATIKITKPKIELGNKETDWTPAPEDIQSELNTSISNLNTNINSRIDDTEGMITDLSGIVDTKIDAATANTIAQNKVNSFLKSSAWLDISGLGGAIRALTNSDDGTYQILEQKDGEWTFQLGKLFTDVKSAVDDITKAKNQLNGSTESTLSKRIDQLDNDTKYIRMTTFEGQPAIILGMQNNFILLENQPDDWNSNYKEYYILDGNNYVHVTGDTAPTWQPNTYYQLSKSKFEVRITNTSMDFLEDGNRVAYVNNNAFYNTVGVVREEIKIVNNNQGFSWKTRSNGNLGLQWVEET